MMSFDIFDTVLTRRLSCPTDVFTILDDRLRKEGFRLPPLGLFRALRMRCERWSRRFESSREVLLPDIYRLLGRFLFWSESQCTRAAEVEREIEASVLVATPFGLKAVNDARSQGHKIAFISDMYLEEKFLRSLLTRENLCEEGELIAVSGEWKCSKADQTIWPTILKRCDISAKELFHQGDNLHSDVSSPQKHGIAAKRLGTGELSRWEQWQSNDSPMSVDEWGRIAALSRTSRVSCEQPDDYWTKLGAGVIGPLLAGFASWTLAQARKADIQTLWFLSRDGWLFHQAAQVLNGDKRLNLKYVGINRLQLRYASEGPRPLNELFSDSRKITWNLLGDRLRFSVREMGQLKDATNVATVEESDLIPPSLQVLLSNVLMEPDWQKVREQRASEAGEAVKSYLAQCQAEGTGRLGIVDVGWAGRTQDALVEYCPSLVHGYYMGLSSQKSNDSPKQAWLFDTDRHLGHESLNIFQRMIEVLIGGVSGPLLGYQKHDQEWVPDFATTEWGEEAPGREMMQRAALEFVKLSAQPDYAGWWSAESMQTYAGWNMRRLLQQPTAEDASAFLHWQITTDDAHQDSIEPARGFDFARVKACLQKKEPWAWLWPEASLKNSTPFGRFIMSAAWKYRRR